MVRTRGGKRGTRGVGRGDRGTRRGTSSRELATTQLTTSSGGSSLARFPVRLINDDERQSVVHWLSHNASSSSQSGPQSSSSSLSVQPQANTGRISQPDIQTTPKITYSEELFDHTMHLGSEGVSKAQEARDADLVCSDAQLLMPSEDEDEAGFSQEIPRGQQSLATPVACILQLEDVECEEEVVTCGDDDDDDIADPTWSVEKERAISGAASVEEEEDDGVVSVRVRPQKERGRPRRSADISPPAVVSGGSRNTGSESKRSRTCEAWAYFDQASDSPNEVICRLCRQRVSRGRNEKCLTTTSMNRHMQAKHELVWNSRSEKHGHTGPGLSTTVTSSASPSSATSRPKRPSAADVQEQHDQTPSPVPDAVFHFPTQSTPSPSVSCTPHSTQSSGQPSVCQLWDRKKRFNPNHPKAKSLNVGIARLLALEMLPFRLVETDGFRHVMALACPQYKMPSRHFFARKAVPALARHVAENISSALAESVCRKVHLTTDTWTSRHGQGRYISLTAHWVTLVRDTASGDGSHPIDFQTAGLVQRSDPQHLQVASCGKRNKAILKLICLGERQHTGQELWTALRAETDRWLGDRLTAGKVVCDNGTNLLAALRIGRLTHIPCMAHVMNLVVQKFLKCYPGIDCLLKKARGLSSHFRRSHPASARLAALQRDLCLPVNRLICDVATRWNSTLHMLQRLWQQRNAIMQYEMLHGLPSSGADLGVFSHREWSQLKDLCTILGSFEEATKMVSRDDALVSLTVLVIYLLEQALGTLRQQVQVVTEEVEEAEEDADTEPYAPEDVEDPTVSQVYSSSLGGGSRSRTGARRQLSLNSRAHEAGQGSGDSQYGEEEEEEEAWVDTAGTDYPSVVRGWHSLQGEEEEEEEEEEVTASAARPRGLGNPGSISHMSAWMLHYLQHDPRIKAIKMNNDYWVATLLDPRYKTKVSSFLPPTEIDTRMQEFETLLVDQLETSFPPSDCNVTVEPHSLRGSSRMANSRSSSSSSRQSGRTLLGDIWHSIFTTAPTPSRQGSSHTHRDRLTTMVHDYLRLNIDAFGLSLDPFNFWVSKLKEWPELAQHAIEMLSCPAASVISERTFSTAGGVITDKRVRLSPDNVDRLTFIKMNKDWISDHFVAPVADVTE